MTDNELLNKIRQSAEDVDIPDSITPERISAKLKHTKTPASHFRFAPAKAISAAAVFLFMGILSGITWNAVYHPSNDALQESGISSNADETADKADENSIPSQKDSTAEPKKNAGTLYTIAKSYDQIYDVLNSSNNYLDGEYYVSYDIDEATADGYDADVATAENYDADTATAGTSNGVMEFAAEDRGEEAQKLSDKESFSTTNLQTEGVDESDLIKTDGSYIYTVKDEHIFITDTANGNLKQITSLHPDLNAADSILELYVDNDALLLLVQHYDTSLEESSTGYYTDTTESSAKKESGFLPLEDATAKSYVETAYSTVLYVYDIKDLASPVLQGTTTQDGYYYTSRKIGDIVYLFTQKSFSYGAVYQKESSVEGGFIPCINNTKIAYDHIYLPEEGRSGLICSSVNIKNPKEVIDDIMVIYDYADIYVGNDSIYLYQSKYLNDETLTEIAKFQIDEGNINAVNATSVKGSVYDTFAIQEYQNNLRILTTSYDNDGNSSNQLYLLDKDLQLTGSLEDISEGEEIYAARYFENTAYFITYRNTDPLFAVDLSDPTNPTLLGELKITGFSEYLHFWGKDHLLGIGYETNPDNGRFLGLKLVMFDISDPVNLKSVDSLVLDNYQYSPALYDYKCVLADSHQNLIGFATETDYSDADYNIYAWEKDHFVKKLTTPLSDAISSDSVRGIYIGDKFYIAAPNEITSFDMSNDFQEISHITLQK